MADAGVRNRLPVLLAAALLQILMLADMFQGTVWPPPAALLLGEHYAGRLAREVDPSLPVLSTWGYDSQYVWAIALDPTLQRPEVVQALDAPAYRYQRILLPLAASLIPGGAPQLPYRFLLLGVVGWALGSWATWKLAHHLAAPPALATVFFTLNAGVLFTLLHPLADLWATTLSVLGIWLWLRGRCLSAASGPTQAGSRRVSPRAAQLASWQRGIPLKLVGGALCFALAALTKETALLVPLAIGAFSVLQRRFWVRENLALAAASLPLVGWQTVIHGRFGIWAWEQSANNLDVPYLGLAKAALGVLLRDRGALDVAVAVGISGLATYTLFRIGRPKTTFDATLSAHAALILALGPAVVEGMGSASRASALFFVLLVIWACARPPARNHDPGPSSSTPAVDAPTPRRAALDPAPPFYARPEPSETPSRPT